MEKKYTATYFLFGLILMVGLTMASTTISDSGSSYDADLTVTKDIILSGVNADITSTSFIDLYPDSQTTYGLRIDRTGVDTTLQSLGSEYLLFDDILNLTLGINVAGTSTFDSPIKVSGDLTVDSTGDIKLVGASSDIMSDSEIDIFPDGSAIQGLRVDLDGGEIVLSALGSSNLKFNDDLILNDLDVTGEVSDTMAFAVDTGIEFHAKDSDILGTHEQSIEFYGDDPDSKPYLAWNTWYDTDQGAGITMDNAWTGWIGCHYNTSINSDAHQHCSWETMDTDTGNVNTRFEISYGKPISNMFAGFSNLNEVRYGTGVDINLYDSGSLRAGISINSTNKNLEFSTTGDNSVSFKPSGTGQIRMYSDLAMQDGEDIFSVERLDFYVSNQYLESISFEFDGTNPMIKSYGSDVLRLGENDILIDGISSDGTGSVVCIKSGGSLGTCTTAVDASGDCSCA